jgi:hypothetical protein
MAEASDEEIRSLRAWMYGFAQALVSSGDAGRLDAAR